MLVPLLLVATALLTSGRASTSARTSDEPVGRAWATEHLGAIDDFTTASDRVPLGWTQLAASSAAADLVVDRPDAVTSGRLTLLVAHLVSSLLLWVLARRLGLARWGAAIAVAVFGLSPLAVHLHRMILVDNLAVPWALAALVLATSLRRRPATLVASGTCFAVAALTSEATVLLLPALAWMVWRSSAPAGRRQALAAAGAPLLVIGGGYAAIAAMGLLPGPDGAGVPFRLFRPDQAGGGAGADSLGQQVIGQWFDLDPVMIVLALVATAATAAWGRTMRPIALGFVVVAAMALRPDTLPTPFLAPMVALAGLLVAGVLHDVRRRWRATPEADRLTSHSVPVSLAAVGTVVVLAISLAVAVPRGGERLGRLVGSSDDIPATAARGWLAANVEAGERVLADDVMVLDLASAPFAGTVAWFGRLDDTPPRTPDEPAWTAYDYLVSSSRLRAGAATSAQTALALANSQPVATFGAGDDRIEIRRIGGATTTPAPDRVQGTPDTPELHSRAGDALLRNPAITASPEAADLLRAGQVDDRLLTLFGTLSADHQFEITAFPPVPGEADSAALRRVAELRVIDGEPVSPDAPSVAAVKEFLAAQPDAFRPDEADVDLAVWPVVFRIGYGLDTPEPP